MKRLFGWILLVVGVLFGAAGVSIFISPEGESTRGDGLAIVLIFGVIPLALGGWLIRSAASVRRALAREQELLGFARTRTRIRLAELCERLRMGRADVERLVERLAVAGTLDLVYSEGGDEYLHRADLAKMGAQVVTACPTCHAALPARVTLPGESQTCKFCGATLTPNTNAAATGTP